ncbi:solute carrier family 23 member 1-like [Glandiceps talaboti]
MADVTEIEPTKQSGEVDEMDTEKRGNRKQVASCKPDHLDLMYTIYDEPPWYLSCLLGLQHYLTMFGATMALPLILAIPLCVEDNTLVKSELMGTIFFVSGLSTLLQSTFGCRLPIVQGGTYTFLVPTFAILSLEKYRCPAKIPTGNTTAALEIPVDAINATTSLLTTAASYIVNSTNPTDINNDFTVGFSGLALANTDPINWKDRMREIQGAIMVSSLVQVVIGFSGLMGVLLKYIGPLSITPTIALVGFSLFDVAGNFAGKHWGICCMTIFLIVLFSQYMKNVNVPSPVYTRSKGLHISWWPLFKLFPVILAIVISWVICVIFTATNVFPNNENNWQYGARTDKHLDVLGKAAWFRLPYPGQWGAPTVSAAGVFGMLAGVLASMIESVGDYYACARLSGAPPPPNHAVNRGIGIEGICCFFAGLWGSGNGTTSYSENIGAIGITKVGSRRVVQWGGALMLVFGILGKFGALFTTIPDPIIGGVFIITFGMVTAVGLSNLQFVDMNSSRNLFIVGFSLFCGMVIPNYLKTNEGAINTGVIELDRIITVLLSTNMFVGGFLGFVLDNTIPGTPKERGLLIWRQLMGEDDQDSESDNLKCYDLPFGMDFIRRTYCMKFVPFCPTFQQCWRWKKEPVPQTEMMNVSVVSKDNGEPNCA